MASLARPGGNATGVALQAVETSKAAQLLKDAVPKISRLVMVYDPRSLVQDREGTAAALKPLGPSRICGIARERRLPMLGTGTQFAAAGCLMGYGEPTADVPRRLAIFIDKILKGAKPADLPVEQPGQLRLIVNLKTAKALGLTIPPSVLLRADQVIE